VVTHLVALLMLRNLEIIMHLLVLVILLKSRNYNASNGASNALEPRSYNASSRISDAVET